MRRRLLEIFPAFLSWGTLILIFYLSWKQPIWIAIFIIFYDIYWLLKTIYLTIHLHSSYRKMRRNLKINWKEKLESLGKDKWQNIYHLVILPMYKEPYEVVKETFGSLAKSDYPKDKIILVLAAEERGGEKAQLVAAKIKKEFSDKFFRLIITKHPADLPGEIPGKGSNENWAAKEVKKLVIDLLNIPYDNILVSVFDVDTQIYPQYFSCLTYNFLTCKNPLRSSFQPVPLFVNNIYQTSAFGQLVAFSSTFWNMMQQARPEKLQTFSSHAMPFKALVEIGYWQKDVVSEDSRIFWQCYLHYNGDWQVIPLLYPVSMDSAAAPTFWKSLINIYKQQRRWGWGVENISYVFEGFIKNKRIPLRAKIFWSFELIEGFHSWATSTLIIFLLGWLPALIGGADFNATLLSYKSPQITNIAMELASIGMITGAILSLTLLPAKNQKNKFLRYILYLFQWLLMPLTLIIFGAIPALESQTRLMLGGKFRLGFWVTPKGRYGEGQMANSE